MRPMRDAWARLGITYLPQETSIFRKLSVEDNIMAVLETMPISNAEKQERLNEQLNELNITHIAKRKAFLLSGFTGGEKGNPEEYNSRRCTLKLGILGIWS